MVVLDQPCDEKNTHTNIFRSFAAGNKIKQFYELLVEDSLQREDVENMSRENMKNLHEIMQVSLINPRILVLK